MKNTLLFLISFILCLEISAQFPNVEFTLDNGISDVTLRNLSTIPASAVALKTSKGSARLRNDGKFTLSSKKSTGLGNNSWTVWPHDENANLYFYSGSNSLRGVIDSETGEYRPAGVQMKHYSGSNFFGSSDETVFRKAFSIQSNYTHPADLVTDLDLPNGAIVDSIHVFDLDVTSERNLRVEVRISVRAYDRVPSSRLLTANYTSFGSNNILVKRTLFPTAPFEIEKMTHSYVLTVRMDWDGPAFPSIPVGEVPPPLHWYGANVFYHFEM